MKELALRFLEYFGLGAEELSELPPGLQPLVEVIPFVLVLTLVFSFLFTIFRVARGEDEEEEGEEGISELDKEIALIKSLQGR